MSRTPYILAGLLIAGTVAWLASGLLSEEQPAPREDARPPQAPLVEVMRSTAALVARRLTTQGDVLPVRSAAARAEASGEVAEIFVNIGDSVEAGQQIARLSLEGRASRLREAQAVLEQRQADYDAAAELLERGVSTEARVRELRTQLESAREAVRQIEEELENTEVAAPFDAVVDTLPVEEGEFVAANAEIAGLVQNSPLRVIARISQFDISRVSLGDPAQVSFATGDSGVGRVCFISASAEPETRTFRVEIRTPNERGEIPSGISAEIDIPTERVPAHFVSPAVLSLATDGALGIKTVSEEGNVSFNSVETVRAESDGLWVSGLPETAQVITTGQGFVQAGDKVRWEAVEEASNATAGADGDADWQLGAPPAEICHREVDSAEDVSVFIEPSGDPTSQLDTTTVDRPGGLGPGRDGR